MANAIVLPLNISFERWISSLNQILPDLFIPVDFKEEDWREWANQLISSNDLNTVPLATRLVFPEKEDWRKWGIYFITLINLS